MSVGHRELAGQGRRLRRLGSASLLGGLLGAWLLVTLPSKAFDAIVPVLILLALVLVVIQPRVARAMAARRRDDDGASEVGPLLLAGVFLAGVYGGYFGAAQGVLLIAMMGMLLQDSMVRINAAKNALALIVNAVAAVFFLFASSIDWTAVLLIAVGSVLGGQLGAKVGRRLPPPALRGLIVVIGLVAVTRLLVG